MRFQSNFDTSETEQCQRCHRSFVYQTYEGNPQTLNGFFFDCHCFICNQAVCSDCSRPCLDSTNDTEFRLCHGCREEYHIPDTMHIDHYSRRSLIALAGGLLSTIGCCNCWNRSKRTDALPSWRICFKCRGWTCPDCQQPIESWPPSISSFAKVKGGHETVCGSCLISEEAGAQRARRELRIVEKLAGLYDRHCPCCGTDLYPQEIDTAGSSYPMGIRHTDQFVRAAAGRYVSLPSEHVRVWPRALLYLSSDCPKDTSSLRIALGARGGRPRFAIDSRRRNRLERANISGQSHTAQTNRVVDGKRAHRSQRRWG